MSAFDTVVERRNTDSLKYDFARERGKPEDILPLWVADMDFKTPKCVSDALAERSLHGIFGYSDGKEDYFEAVRRWFSERFGWEVQPSWLVKTPGVVYAISCAIRALTEKGDGVLIQQPVYYPFTEAVVGNGRRLAVNELVCEDGRYSIDFADFEEKLIRERVKLFLLCSPHNPVGRVWTEAELTRMGELCLRHGVVVVSDEIHADFTYPGHRHLIFAGLRPEFADIAITCTSPSKTFNLAGLQLSNIFISNRELRRSFKEEVVRSGYSQPNVMGLVACRAAYSEGGEWLSGLRDYLLGNLDFLREYLREQLPQIRLVEPEGTYLTWLDFRGLGLGERELERLIVKGAGLWLDAGTMFGAGGEGYQRINIACPRSVLQEAMERLRNAVEAL